MNAIDTNILLYVNDPRDPVKQDIADKLVRSVTNGALVWQVACEYLAASRKLEPLGFSRERAWRDVQRLGRVWTVVFPSWNAIDRAEQLLQRYKLSFWDALLIAVCLEGGVTRLYSEDLHTYRRIATLEFVNPFSPT